MQSKQKQLGKVRDKPYRSIILKTEIYDEVAKIAHRNDRSVTKMIRILLEDALHRYNEGMKVGAGLTRR